MKQLRRIRDLTELTIQATDGKIGSAQDLYFDEHSWAVRYVVVNTGGWLLGRQVLLAPKAIGAGDDVRRTLSVALTKEQIERSPPIETAAPVSREFEEAYFRYFQWAPYWQPGPTAWAGTVPYPGAPPLSIEGAFPTPTPGRPHLRSSHDVTGYAIHARDGEIGHVEDFVVDDADWVIRYMEVDTRNWLPGKHVLLQTMRIDHISWADRSVAVALTRYAIESAPPYDPSQLITPDYEVQLFKHYGQEAA